MRTWTTVGGLTLALTLATSSPARADKPLWLDRPDLHAHFWLSYGLALTATEVLEGPAPAWGPRLGTGRALAVSTGAVAALGLFKELGLDDAVGGDDLIADALGLALNAAVQVIIEF